MAAKKKTAKKKGAAKKKAVKKAAPKAVKETAKKTAGKTARKAGRLLGKSEPQPWRVENARAAGAGLVVCDHASNRVPAALKDLGLKKATLKKHIGWDIGAEDAALWLAKALDMPAVVANYSRLVIDLNRSPAHHEAIPEVSDHIKIPANRDLGKAARAQRLSEIFKPYQKKVQKMVDAQVSKGKLPFILSVHSMTPVMDGVKRPWHISLLFRGEERIARAVAQNIRRAHPDILVGENEPYTLFSDRFAGSTIWRHGEQRGLPYVFVEFRQDLVDTKQKAAHWAKILFEAMQPVLNDPAVFAGRKAKTAKSDL